MRSNQTKLYLLHEAIYHNEPFNSQYAIDYEHETLIFAVNSEVFSLLIMNFVGIILVLAPSLCI